MAMPRAAALMTSMWASVLVFAALSGCSMQSAPSEDAGRALAEKRIAEEGHGYLRLVSFAKTNGQHYEILGVKSYSMEFEAVVEFVKDGCYGGGFGANQFRPAHEECYYNEALKSRCCAPYCMIHYGPSCDQANHLRAGQRRTIRGALDFKLTERGWRPL